MPGMLLLHSEFVKEFVCQNLVIKPDPLGKCSQGHVDLPSFLPLFLKRGFLVICRRSQNPLRR
jgi:hypothetical protein